ncbi:unnamed protein product [Thlaspi arvense]|uniref:RNase H type-1 domain-containing protein n=1 Tax=Thlaspi arvense TaxID=13288 RepID=A0AAU9RUN9_THLAR|nr:unnamed protein product [Thlaspi arvense]
MGGGQATTTMVSNALESEAQALIITMQHCWSKGYKQVMFLGDSQVLKNLIDKKELQFGMINWLRDI